MMKPKIICYCGSLRVALDAFKKAEYQSVIDGNIALLPCCMFVDIQREYGAESDYKVKADELHKRKIDICDEVFVLNVGGYIGESTRSEIKYAESISKPIKFLEGNEAPKEPSVIYRIYKDDDETQACSILGAMQMDVTKDEFDRWKGNKEIVL